jgi:5-methyltetrahydropteroyltriglutamate--homocysteine methyltransferase
MVHTANLGYPRFGAKRELKKALESYWSGKITETELLAAGKQLRLTHWQLQQAAGIDVIPSNDFSFYDQVLDTTLMVGAMPARYQELNTASLEAYFAMGRGFQKGSLDIPAMEMTKWFDTNYHYLVPEIAPGQSFKLTSTKIIDEFLEAKSSGIHTRPVLLGPVSYLLLSKTISNVIPVEQIGATLQEVTPLDELATLLPIYIELLQRLADAGADWVQMDEPCLVLDLDAKAHTAYRTAYAQLSQVQHIQIMLATYFGALADNLTLAIELPTAGLHVDLMRAPGQLNEVLAILPADKILSVGVVDGRNIWRTDLDAALAKVQQAVSAVGSERVQVAPSCSLMFSPHDLDLETELDSELKSWLAFAQQKLTELVLLKRAVNEGAEIVTEPFAVSRAAVASRRQSERTHNPQVRQRQGQVNEALLSRRSAYPARKAQQADAIPLPPLPTTTIGSFPQTTEVRAQRTAFNKGSINQAQYDAFLKAEIERTIRLQEDIGLDVLVHGEFERTDMVEYFGEQLDGFAFTQHGWVQSYGSRGVRPPVIYGDVARPAPMTVAWSAYAQTLTARPMKGMLTGPVTILQWSFVRDDQPRSVTCQQIALALRDEVVDLQNAGIRIIQIDEPALREGLPLRQSDQQSYLQWAVDCFRLTAAGVNDETQIHTHMCYAEFNDILDAIARMDADVISIEASRSKLELLEAFQHYQYPNDIGPGIYDIHSPRVPSELEMEALIVRAAGVIPLANLWVNPDCGLKTRRWEEVLPALRNMVEAARKARETLVKEPSLPDA